MSLFRGKLRRINARPAKAGSTMRSKLSGYEMNVIISQQAAEN